MDGTKKLSMFSFWGEFSNYPCLFRCVGGWLGGGGGGWLGGSGGVVAGGW